RVALENLRKAPLDPLGPVIVAITEGVAGVGAADRREDRRGNSGRVVACEIHACPRGPGAERMQFCCAAAAIRGPLVTCRKEARQQTARSARFCRAALLRTRLEFGILGQHYCPN